MKTKKIKKHKKVKIKKVKIPCARPRFKSYVEIIIEGRESKVFTSRGLPTFTQTLNGSWLEFSIAVFDKDTLDFMENTDWFIIKIKYHNIKIIDKSWKDIRFKCQLDTHEFIELEEGLCGAEPFKLFAMVEK